jgi:hypothetical protein
MPLESDPIAKTTVQDLDLELFGVEKTHLKALELMVPAALWKDHPKDL